MLSQDISCDGTGETVIAAGSSYAVFFLKRKNISNALLSAGKYFKAGKCVFSSSLLCQSEHSLIAAWLHIFTPVYKR